MQDQSYPKEKERAICNLVRNADGVVEFRKCSKCQLVLAVSDFHRDNVSAAGGYQRTCKTCHREIVAKRRREGKGKKPTRQEKLESLRRWRKAHPEKATAHSKVQRAVRNGTITRQLCFCGKKGEAHHADYSKPLDVEWLCRRHHADRHIKNEIPEVPFVDFKYYPRSFSIERTKDPGKINHPLYKLSPEIAKTIRQRRAEGEGAYALAKEYGVWPSTVYKVLHDERWKSDVKLVPFEGQF